MSAKGIISTIRSQGRGKEVGIGDYPKTVSLQPFGSEDIDASATQTKPNSEPPADRSIRTRIIGALANEAANIVKKINDGSV